MIGELIMADKEDFVFDVFPQTLVVVLEILNFQFHEYVQSLEVISKDF